MTLGVWRRRSGLLGFRISRLHSDCIASAFDDGEETFKPGVRRAYDPFGGHDRE